MPQRRSRATAPTVVALAATVALLAACGSTGSSTATPSEASKPAGTIFADAESALDHVHSFRYTGTYVQNGEHTSVEFDAELPERFRAVLESGSSKIALVGIADRLYVYANADFFRSNGLGPSAASVVADRWILLPAGSISDLDYLFAITDPATAGFCVLGPHTGALSVRGTKTLNGQRVIVLADAGNVPASTPSLLYLRDSNTPLPVRAVQTGPQHPGGTPSAVCHETKAELSQTGTDETDTYSDYDTVSAITAPPHALVVPRVPGTSV